MSWEVREGDCLDVLGTVPAASVDSVITDPPYGLGFMGKAWDHGVPGVPFWSAALRVAKPGAMLFAFGGTRTWHRLACAIEDAGWEIRDTLVWLHGQGFPKSLDVSKAIDKEAGAEREAVGRKMLGGKPAPNRARAEAARADGWARPWRQDAEAVLAGETETAAATDAAKLWHGYGTALKPAHEPIIVAMKPLDGTFAQNAQRHGVAGLWIDGARIGCDWSTDPTRRGWQGRKAPDRGMFSDGENVRAEHSQPNAAGRWPSNVVLDEEAARMLDEQSGELHAPGSNGQSGARAGVTLTGLGPSPQAAGRTDSGGASRFMYCAKADTAERTCNGHVTNKHPTVKPLALMQWLCRLSRTPTGGVVLDPFCGSGSTGIAALREGRSFIGIEQDAENVVTARARIVADAPLLNTPAENDTERLEIPA